MVRLTSVRERRENIWRRFRAESKMRLETMRSFGLLKTISSGVRDAAGVSHQLRNRRSRAGIQRQQAEAMRQQVAKINAR
jgi:hypothetical protein